MTHPAFRSEWLTETAVLLEAQAEQSLNLSIVLDQLATHFRDHAPEDLRQSVSSFKHILLEFAPGIDDQQAEAFIHHHLKTFKPYEHQFTDWRIPVDYCGEDLEQVAETLKLSVHQIIALHTGHRWRVQALGFAPGFAYLADAPAALRLPRRAHARLKVTAGSVAIAEQFSAIYPVDSPGGWHLIGYTSHPLFDWQHNPPGLFKIGDWVTFYDSAQP